MDKGSLVVITLSSSIFWFCREYMYTFVPDKGDKSKVLKIFNFLIELPLESAATFWFLILHGLISVASHRKFSSESVKTNKKTKHIFGTWLLA